MDEDLRLLERELAASPHASGFARLAQSHARRGDKLSAFHAACRALAIDPESPCREHLPVGWTATRYGAVAWPAGNLVGPTEVEGLHGVAGFDMGGGLFSVFPREPAPGKHKFTAFDFVRRAVAWQRPLGGSDIAAASIVGQTYLVEYDEVADQLTLFRFDGTGNDTGNAVIGGVGSIRMVVVGGMQVTLVHGPDIRTEEVSRHFPEIRCVAAHAEDAKVESAGGWLVVVADNALSILDSDGRPKWSMESVIGFGCHGDIVAVQRAVGTGRRVVDLVAVDPATGQGSIIHSMDDPGFKFVAANRVAILLTSMKVHEAQMSGVDATRTG